MQARILFVDDDLDLLRIFSGIFRPFHYEVVTANSAEDALEIMKSSPPFHVVVSDYIMTGITGDKFLREVAKEWPATKRIILSAYCDKEKLLAAINDGGVHRYLLKPWLNGELISVISEMVEDYDCSDFIRAETIEASEKNQILTITNKQLEKLVSERTKVVLDYQHQLQDAKEADDELLLAINHSFEVRKHLNQTLSNGFAEQTPQSQKSSNTNKHSNLSKREFEILKRVTEGQSLKVIASELELSIKTVSTYKNRLFSKMGFHSLSDLISYALKNDISL